MEVIEVLHKNRVFKIKRKTIVFVLQCLSNVDFSEKDDKTIIKAMEKYKLLDEVTLESML